MQMEPVGVTETLELKYLSRKRNIPENRRLNLILLQDSVPAGTNQVRFLRLFNIYEL